VDPIVFSCHGEIHKCYPVVNGWEEDAFWEMIIGRDVIGKDFFGTSWCESSDNGQTATPGPSYIPNTSFMGHNICRVENGEKVILQELDRVYGRISLPTISKLEWRKTLHSWQILAIIRGFFLCVMICM
jgi:hypothetical protein